MFANFEKPTQLFQLSEKVVTQVDVTDLQVYVILKHYLPIPIFIVSILCILVTLIAVTQRGLWRTTVTYIIVLAIVDLFTLISLCILSMDFFIIPALPEGLFTRVYFLIETILGELVDTLLLISNWLTVLIATERYLAVCHPLKVRFIDCKYRRIFIILVILSNQNHIETITPNKPFGFVDYINPISVIALALKSDLSFFFYCCSHPHLQKLTKSHQNEQKNIIELNMPSSGSLPAEYRLPHHHYKDGGEYYQYRIPVDMNETVNEVVGLPSLHKKKFIIMEKQFSNQYGK
ncbi:hypothetical protein Smp_012920 [Schistosoma mansoni]|uniref:hypothetical protein n=1 Tax=Schistosoma mansoni TaxID=6183 RepID=UPI0001A6311D|nr:hypothetical protein Smp_012920 [Schistosoma mansoni]|eukprot:XP_018648173.1 hypothetical protein Smp_012920 [Schistosoma mansoni]